MPISKWNEDGTVNIYNTKTGYTQDNVKPEELQSISPNLVKAYYEGMTPEAQATRLKSQKEYEALQGGTYESPETQKIKTDLRSEYFTRTKENNFIDVTNNYGKIKSAPNTAAGDVSMIFAYMKLIDPSSVVREGEFATAQQTAGIPQQIVNAYNKALRGKRLGDKQRADFLDSSTALYNQYKVSQKQIDDFYIQLAQQQGINSEDLGIGTIGYREQETLGTPATALPTTQTTQPSTEVPPTVAEAMAGKRGVGLGAPSTVIKKKDEEEGGWLKDVAVNMVETALGMPGIVAEAGKQVYNAWLNPELKAISKKIENGTATDAELNKYVEAFDAKFIKQKELEQASKGVGQGALVGLKKGAGTASFAVPGGGGTLAQVVGRGALSGALYGAGQFDEEKEATVGETLKDLAVGGVTGGTTAGLMYGAGKLLKPVTESTKKTMVKAGEKLGISGRIKAIGGAPKEKLGGIKLFKDMDDVGINSSSQEKVIETATNVINQNQDEMLKGIERAGGGKLEVRTSYIIDDLTKMKNAAPTAKKNVIQNTIKDILGDTGGKPMKLTDFYKLKQKYGEMGKWKMGSEMGLTQSGIYEKVYMKMNDIMDDALKSSGFSQFRANNKAINIAIKALDYVDDVATKTGKQSIVKWSDIMTGVGGGAVFGPGGIVGAPIVSRILSSPAFQKIAGKTLVKAGTTGLGPVGTALRKGTEYIVPKVVSGQTTR